MRPSLAGWTLDGVAVRALDLAAAAGEGGGDDRPARPLRSPAACWRSCAASSRSRAACSRLMCARWRSARARRAAWSGDGRLYRRASRKERSLDSETRSHCESWARPFRNVRRAFPTGSD